MKAARPHKPAAEVTLAGLEWPRLWSALEERLATAEGRGAAERVRFLKSLSAVRASLALIGEMAALRSEAGPLDFSGVRPLAPLLERVEKEGALDAAELAQVLETQQAALGLAQALDRRPEAPGLEALAAACRPEPELVAALAGALTSAGELNEQAFPELAALRKEQTRRREAIHKKLEATLRNRSLAPAFQEKIYTLRGARYVLPLKADFRGQLPGIVHDVSASGATLFVEPQAVVEEGNALTLVEKQLEAHAARILAELSATVGRAAPALRENLRWLGRVDLVHAQAALALDYQGAIPHVEKGGALHLKGAANPLMLLESQPVVRNDVALDDEAQCMVVSGANTGGKTVLLKTVGLCALLVRCGMPVPAQEGSRCDLFSEVLADVGDRQSLSASLSTFSAQIAFMGEALSSAGPASLVLIDEILTGTAPEEGAALAATLLEALAERGARCLVTTHYGELKELAAAHPAMVNASVAFDLDNLAPTYRLLAGTPGASYAIPIARRHGLDDGLVEKAQTRLAGRPAAAEALLAELHSQQQRLLDREEKLAGQERELASVRGGLDAREKSLAETEREVRLRERGMIGKEVEEARRRIAGVIKELQGANSLPLAGKVRERLGEVERELLPAAPTPPPEEPGLRPDRLRAGDAVLIRSLNKVGSFARLLRGGRKARVELGALAMEVDVAELAPPPARSRKGPKAGKQALPAVSGGAAGGNGAGSGAQSSGAPEVPEIGFVLSGRENTLDLRGLRLAVALTRVEEFCDMSVMKYVSPVVLIHGHGTGKLKSGVRDWLKASSYVAGFRPGAGGEGWDGVTVVALNL